MALGGGSPKRGVLSPLLGMAVRQQGTHSHNPHLFGMWPTEWVRGNPTPIWASALQVRQGADF